MSVHLQQISRATHWLLHSGIQEQQGGVARYYRSDTGRNANVSTEITGYYAAILAWLHKATGNEQALHQALFTAEFLVNRAWNATLKTFPFEMLSDDSEQAPAYFFDCGIIVRGLLAAWQSTGVLRYRKVAESCALQMAKDFDAAGFDFHPVIQLPSKSPSVRDPRWSQSSGCYQLKAALAFHQAAHLTQDAGLHDAWLRVWKQSLMQHDQFLPGHSGEERVMDRLHAYCYFLEALLAATPHAESNRAIALGIQRVAYLLHKIEPVFVRSDVYAQLLRARIYADQAGILPMDTHTAALEMEQLRQFQLTSPDPRVDGGFCFGRKGGAMLPYVNPVSTAFAVQALYLWDAVQKGSLLPPASELV